MYLTICFCFVSHDANSTDCIAAIGHSTDTTHTALPFAAGGAYGGRRADAWWEPVDDDRMDRHGFTNFATLVPLCVCMCLFVELMYVLRCVECVFVELIYTRTDADVQTIGDRLWTMTGWNAKASQT